MTSVSRNRYEPVIKGLGILTCHACGGTLRDHEIGQRCPNLGDLRITVGKPAWGRGDSSSAEAAAARKRRARAKQRALDEGNPGPKPGESSRKVSL